jgi:hypothetical protein
MDEGSGHSYLEGALLYRPSTSLQANMFSLPSIGLAAIFSILLCVHVVRTGREMYWLMIILFTAPLGGIVYLIAIVLPEMLGGGTARKVAQAARDTLDPDREYREAAIKADESPTVGNKMRLAAAASAMGRHQQAEQLYGEAAQGIHAEDPALLLGRAKALIELERPADAMAVLQSLEALGEEGRTPQANLAKARALEALERPAEADQAYQAAMARLPGLEALARYACFLKNTGKDTEAQVQMAEINKRSAAASAHFRKEARIWRDFAAQRIGT